MPERSLLGMQMGWRKELRSCVLEVLGDGCDMCKGLVAERATPSQISSMKMKMDIQ